MSKKFIVFSLAVFALIINIALAIYFTLPLDSVEPAQHRMKASIADSSVDISSLDSSAEAAVADDMSEDALASIPTQDMSLGTDMPPVAEIPETDSSESVEEADDENSLVLNDSYMQKLMQTSQSDLKSPMQIVQEIEDAKKAQEALEQESASTQVEGADLSQIPQESATAQAPAVEAAVKIQTIPVVEEKIDEEIDEKVEEVKESPKPARKVVNEITMGYAGNVLTLRVKGNQAMKGKTMYVGNPERALLDIEGKWYLPELPQFPQNPYSTNIRTGYQENATRFVIDITTTKFTRRLVQVDSNTVELRVTFQ